MATDVPALAALTLRAIRDTNSRDYDPAAIAALCARFDTVQIAARLSYRHVFVATLAGTIVGTASLGEGQAQSVFVDPAWHRQGVGRALMRHVEREALASGTSLLRLSALLSAIAFYQRLGYAALQFDESDGVRMLLMEKRLNRAPGSRPAR